MADVVYTIADLSKYHDDFELRYSLRSLARQQWVDKVFLVGHKPDWATDVIHIPCDNPYYSKDANIINKIMKVCRLPGLSARFVVNSDDHYILQPINLEALGPWLENPSQLPIAYKRQRVSLWHKRLVATVKYCEKMVKPPHVWECHIPYVVDKVQYPKVMKLLPWKNGNGLVTHSYFNFLPGITAKVAPEGMVVRIKNMIPLDQLRILAKRALFFNHDDVGLCPSVQQFLQESFPDPCRWEK